MLKTAYALLLATILYISIGFIFSFMELFTYPEIWRFNPRIDIMVYWLLHSLIMFLYMFAAYKLVLGEKMIRYNDIIAKFILAFAYAELLQEIIAQFFMYGESSNDLFALIAAGVYAVYSIWKRKKKEEKPLTG